MSEREPDSLTDDDAEVVDALVVEPDGAIDPPAAPAAVVEQRAVSLPARSVPVAQAAAVAATGFAAGAVTAVAVRAVGKRRQVKAATKRSTRHGLPIAGTRSFLVDVHLLGGKD